MQGQSPGRSSLSQQVSGKTSADRVPELLEGLLLNCSETGIKYTHIIGIHN